MKNEKEFYSLVSDSAFKYLFKNDLSKYIYQKIIEYFINIDLNEYEITDGELNNGVKIKTYVTDILFKNINNKKVLNIEMNSRYSEASIAKNDQYILFLAGRNFDKGEEYRKYQAIQVNFNNYRNEFDKEIGLSLHKLQDNEHNLSKEVILIYDFYLPSLKELCYDNNINKYINLLTAKSYEEIKEICNSDKELEIFMEEYDKMVNDEEFRYSYDYENVQRKLRNTERSIGREEGKKEGLAEGLSEGKEIEKHITAKKMLEKDMDISLISEITDLSIEEITSLKEEINK